MNFHERQMIRTPNRTPAMQFAAREAGHCYGRAARLSMQGAKKNEE